MARGNARPPKANKPPPEWTEACLSYSGDRLAVLLPALLATLATLLLAALTGLLLLLAGLLPALLLTALLATLLLLLALLTLILVLLAHLVSFQRFA